MRKVRKIRSVFVVVVMILGVWTFMFGMLAHGSTIGTSCEILGMCLSCLSIYMGAVRFEVKL